jgi:SAM-dependent methyltransferase
VKTSIEEVRWSWANPIIQDLLLKYYREYLFSTPEQADNEIQRVLDWSSMRPPGTVLDMGCGLGYHAASFARRGFEVVAFDPGDRYVDLARRHAAHLGLRIDVRQMDCSKLAEDQRFDLAWAGAYCPGQLEPLELLGDFRRIYNALIPGRWFVATVAGKARARFSEKVRRWEEKEDCFVLEEEWTDASHCYEDSWFVYPDEGRIIKVIEVDRIYDVAVIQPLLQEAGFLDVESRSDLGGKEPANPGQHFAFRCRRGEA